MKFAWVTALATMALSSVASAQQVVTTEATAAGLSASTTAPLPPAPTGAGIAAPNTYQPVPTYPPGYVPPGYVQPGYVQPGYVQPVYGQPMYGQPMYGQPMYGQPVYGTPVMIAPRTTEVPYNGGPVPPGATVVTRPNTGLVATGASLFAVSYGLSLFPGFAGLFISPSVCSRTYSSTDCGLEWLLLPVAGPWIAMGFNRSPTGYALLAIDGIAQGVGMGLLIAGAVTSRKALLLNNVTARRDSIQWAITPGTAATSLGATLTLVHM